jgi:streptogramin lyase
VSVTRKGRTSSYGDGNQIESMHIDPAGHLWVTDGSTVTRIDDVADVSDGTVFDLVPGAQIQT